MKMVVNMADDVAVAVRHLSVKEKKPVGQLISDLVRKGLTGRVVSTSKPSDEFFGFRPFPSRGGRVTNKAINDLRKREGV